MNRVPPRQQFWAGYIKIIVFWWRQKGLRQIEIEVALLYGDARLPPRRGEPENLFVQLGVIHTPSLPAQ